MAGLPDQPRWHDDPQIIENLTAQGWLGPALPAPSPAMQAAMLEAVAAYQRTLHHQIEQKYKPIGCGTMVGSSRGEQPRPCSADGPICAACWDRRNDRDDAMALVGVPVSTEGPV